MLNDPSLLKIKRHFEKIVRRDPISGEKNMRYGLNNEQQNGYYNINL